MSSKVKVELPDAAVEVEEPKDKKIPYDDLMNIANNLSATNSELKRRLNDAMLGNFFTRLDFLFKVVKEKESFPEDFVKYCIDEIVESMKIEEEKTKE